MGVHPQAQDGLFYLGLNVTVGRIAGRDLAGVGRLSREYGDGEVRLATDQNLILTGVPADRVDALCDEPLLETCSPFPGPFERGAVARTGSEFCRFRHHRDQDPGRPVGPLAGRAFGSLTVRDPTR